MINRGLAKTFEDLMDTNGGKIQITCSILQVDRRDSTVLIDLGTSKEWMGFDALWEMLPQTPIGYALSAKYLVSGQGMSDEEEAIRTASKIASKEQREVTVYKAIKKVTPQLNVNVEDID